MPLDSTGQEICHQTTASHPTLIPRVHTSWVPGPSWKLPCGNSVSCPQGRDFVTVTVPANVRTEKSSGILLKPPGFGRRRALQKAAFPFLPQMTETLKLRIVPLHPLPFTPADVFFISLGGLDFPHVLPSSSSRLPRASHNKPACWAAEQAGPLTCVLDMPLAVFQPSPGAGGWSRGPASAVQVGLACLQPAHGFTVLGPHKDLSLFVSHGALCILQ